MAATQYVDVPGYKALLLRRSYPELSQPGGLMDRAQEWFAGRGPLWNEQKHRWTFPSGAVLEFGYLQRSTDRYRYQGAEFDFIGFDELTHFAEADYLYLFSRLRRRSDSQIPPRMRAASNPGGKGHRWVKDRFIDGQLPPDRRFIPAKLSDNPGVDQESYRRNLEELDPQTRAQLLDGNWDAREPGDWVFQAGLDEVFAKGAEIRRLLAAKKLPPVGDQTVLSADWGVHSHLLLLWPLEGDGIHVHREFVYEGTSVRKLVPGVKRGIMATEWPCHQERFDASMPGLNDAFLEDLNAALPFEITSLAIPFGKYKALTIDHLQLLVSNAVLGVAPLLSIDEENCPVLAEQIRGWRYKDPDVNRTEKGDDHGPDALIAGAAPAAAKRQQTFDPREPS